jgi:hypothetical protein
MKKIAWCGMLLLAFLVTVGFSQRAYCAEQVRLNEKAKAEISEIFNDLREFFPESFDAAKISNTDLIIFGIYNVKPEPKRSPDGSYYVSTGYVDQAVKRYFNRTVKHGSIEKHPLRNGKYFVEGGDRGLPCTIKITGVAKVAVDKIVVSVDILDPDEGDKFMRSEKALLQWVGEVGNAHFVVLKYQVPKNSK